ncbi:hypothetical protein FH972_021903 [Carpinus fangiana]|uniref:GST N-terminal domain-containing protein n=1 Tax=Carpinus fangiana TaxID=176857 RepID=A0A5N6KRB7_9ROSI|nr:hypothetical protein FH972_021903 [Carpinus fangiana]
MDPQRAQHFTVQPLIPYQQLQAEQLLPPHIASNASPFTHRLIDASTATRFQDVPHYPGLQSIPIQMPYPQQHTPVVPLYRTSDNGQLQRQIATISGAKQRPSMPERQITDTATKEQLTGQTSSVAIRTQDPPNLQEWRKKLFAVDEMLTLTQDEFETYFRYVDNVYSHRSTQRYKRNPFIAQYWDCRLKGRPPGTRKSEDPNKKKRKRVARERDQCDVKIKIVEFFPGVVVQSGFDAAMCTAASEDARETVAPGTTEFTTHPPVATSAISTTHSVPEPGWTMPLTSAGGMSIPEASAAGQKIYTILRVNGGAAGDGGTPSSHRHSLEYSDKVKRNSVARERLKDEREKKKIQKTYHKKASGPALDTVKRHSRDETLVMFGSCFCPFVQRVWISLEQKGIPYQYIEVDPYKKPQSLLDVNPRGLVPALRHGNWACNESTVLMEYVSLLY